MVTISLCMIVKNEEKVIRRCLSCAKSFVDEIIVVDTGSTDHTKEIAREMGAQVFYFEWIDDFAAARNFSFSKATMDYILWLDADDIIDQENQQKLKELKYRLDSSIDVIMMHYEMNHMKDESPIIFDRERIVKREKNFQWNGRIHETLSIEGKIIYQDITIQHQKMTVNDPNRNLSIFKKMEKENVVFSPREIYYYARELQYHGLIEEAIQKYETFLKENGWVEDLLQACYELGNCYMILKQRQKAFFAYIKSFQYEVPTSQICNAIGFWFLDEKEYEQAAYWYEQSIRSTHRGGFEKQDDHDFLPALQLAICYYYLDEKEIAKHWFHFAENIHPTHKLIQNNRVYFS